MIAQITGLMGALRRMASLLAVITLAFSTVVWAESVQAITAPELRGQFAVQEISADTVSYTHLTLPTTLSV